MKYDGSHVTISNDPLLLGEAATSATLAGYVENLEAHLAERFGRRIQVRTGSVSRVEGDPADVVEYVRDLHSGDVWIGLVP